MTTLLINDLSEERELDAERMDALRGGMMKLPSQRANVGGLLMSPDGEPVSVYVDGVLVNSVGDGYVHH
jgi:hypothetical protein